MHSPTARALINLDILVRTLKHLIPRRCVITITNNNNNNKCCPCNGAKAKCNRCICVRRKTPCVSCLPGKSSCCQNSLCNRQERSVSSVVVSSSRTTCPAGPGLLSQSVSSSNSRSSLSFGNSLRGSVTNANDSVGVLRESVGENSTVGRQLESNDCRASRVQGIAVQLMLIR